MLKHVSVQRRMLRALLLLAMLVSGLGFGHFSTVQAETTVTPAGEKVTAGPWEITLIEATTGDDAAGLAAGAGNADSPAENGTQYVAAHFSMHNASGQAQLVAPDDFAAVGDDGFFRRSAAIFQINPPLSGNVAAGGDIDGWVLSSVESDTKSVVIFYDSTTISGTWADHAFAVTEGATFEPKTKHTVDPNQTGTDPGAPAGPGDVVATDEWSVEIVDVVTGPGVNDISPETTQRLGNNYLAAGQYAICLETWVAIQIQVTNNADDGLTRTLPQTAFLLANADGSNVLDVRMLSAPAPEVGAEYAAGASRAGWISFELPSLCEYDNVNLSYFDNLLRFQPFASSADPRYLTWGGGSPSPDPTEATIDENDVLPVGTTLVVPDGDTVNLRTDPSTSGDMVAELEEGTEVEVTGEPQTGDGYIWYPVTVTDSGDEGWVVAEFLAEP